MFSVFAFFESNIAFAQKTIEKVQQDDRKAKNLFHKGLAAVKKKSWLEALALFQECYELSGRIPVLVNIGTVQRKLELYVEARNTFLSFLEASDSKNEKNDYFNKRVQREIKEIEKKIGKVKFRLANVIASDHVQMNGRVIKNFDILHDANPGRMLVQVIRDGKVIVSNRSFVKPGGIHVVKIDLPKTLFPKRSTETVTILNRKKIRQQQSKISRKKWIIVGSVVGGLVAVGVIVGSVLGTQLNRPNYYKDGVFYKEVP